MTNRTTTRLSDERKQLLDQASQLVASGPTDDSPRSEMIDVALTHLIQSVKNIEDAGGEVNPETIHQLANTDVPALHYRTNVDSR